MIFMFSFLFLLEELFMQGRNLCTKNTLSCDQFCILVVSFQWTKPRAHPINSMLIQRLFSFVEYRKLLWDHTDCIRGSDKCKRRNSHFSKESKEELIVPRV